MSRREEIQVQGPDPGSPPHPGAGSKRHVRRTGGPAPSEPREARRVEGFTLIELLLVVVIIGILAALIVPKLAGRSEDARRAAAQADIATLAASLDHFEIDLGRYPSTDEGLSVLIQPPAGLTDPNKWKGPYINKKDIPLDPWGTPYKYVYPGQNGPKTFELYSAGPDKQEGTDDDISH
jgi:general secretion pathway protein G